MKRLAVMLLPCLLAAAAALAQAPQGTGPPQPDLRSSPPSWIGFFVIFVLTVLVMAVSLMPAKRGHQD